MKMAVYISIDVCVRTEWIPLERHRDWISSHEMARKQRERRVAPEFAGLVEECHYSIHSHSLPHTKLSRSPPSPFSSFFPFPISNPISSQKNALLNFFLPTSFIPYSSFPLIAIFWVFSSPTLIPSIFLFLYCSISLCTYSKSFPFRVQSWYATSYFLFFFSTGGIPALHFVLATFIINVSLPYQYVFN